MKQTKDTQNTPDADHSIVTDLEAGDDDTEAIDGGAVSAGRQQPSGPANQIGMPALD